MAKPKLLDLFCKAGGCSMGYHLAGFDVTGVDIEPQPHYPFPFIQADAMTFDLSEYDVIHASPPCQAYSVATATKYKKNHPDLLAPIREKLQSSHKIWIIENVIGAPIQYAMILCGSQFNLPIRRHRYFETSLLLFSPGPCKHQKNIYSIHGHNVWLRNVKHKHGTKVPLDLGHKAMGITWKMNRNELSNAIPPAYTEYIGKQLINYL